MTSLLLVLLIVSCGSDAPPESERTASDFRQWKLPSKLREISGLALTADERLLAITDEEAVVYELDYREGRIVKTFEFGDPVVQADFEGIAVHGDTVWLLTSDGMLFAGTEAADGQSVSYESFDTGHGEYCELEGLAQDREENLLILACKETASKDDGLMLFEWRLSAGGVEFMREVGLPEEEITDSIDKKHVNPSGIALDPASGDWILVAARQDALITLRADGELAEAAIFRKKRRHKQAEGIEMTRDGRMLIADEGDGGKARLAVYGKDPAGDHDGE